MPMAAVVQLIKETRRQAMTDTALLRGGGSSQGGPFPAEEESGGGQDAKPP